MKGKIKMGVFEDTITKAREIIGQTGKATEEMIGIQKLKFEVSSLKSAIAKNYQLLGEYTYRTKINSEDNETAISALTEEISEQIVKQNELEKKIAIAKGQKICECGAVNKDGAKFCSGCGKEL